MCIKEDNWCRKEKMGCKGCEFYADEFTKNIVNYNDNLTKVCNVRSKINEKVKRF